jgi:creatinine amidohydrolase
MGQSLRQPLTLEDMTWPEARDALALKPVGLLPIGAIEAHGPHLPLNTDIIIARAFAQRGAAILNRAGVPTLILPPVSYSVSFAGSCFPGTIPVTSESLAMYLTDVLEYVAGQGLRAICICNAHLEPRHVETLEHMVHSVANNAPIPVVFPDKRSPEWAKHLGDEFQRGARHAGQYETSIVLAAAPESVRRTHLEELEPVWIDLPEAIRSGARDFREAGSELGYFGDPAAASAEHGRQLIDELGRMVYEAVMSALAQSPG